MSFDTHRHSSSSSRDQTIRATACSQAVKSGRVAPENKIVSRSTSSFPVDDPHLLAGQHYFSEDSETVARYTMIGAADWATPAR